MVSVLVFAGSVAHAAATVTINAGIPGSSDVASPAGIVANFYQFAVFFGGLVAFAVIVYAGVRYTLAAGNPSTQSDARDQITQALLGLLMLLGVYLLLNVINPDLVKLSMPELTAIPAVTSGGLSSGGGGGGAGAGTGTGNCTPLASGIASAENLQGSCFGANAQTASTIAHAESGGNPTAINPTARCGGNAAVVGLFQINISANRLYGPGLPSSGLNCPSAFSGGYSYSHPNCTVTDSTLYSQCVTAAKDPNVSIATACQLSRNGTNWRPWETATICGIR
jgi:hypothetical protein